MNNFKFGAASEAQMVGVSPRLIQVVRLALAHSTQDFGVHDGLRNDDEQAALVRSGASQTMNSKHRRQADGFGHAVDLVPYVNGKLRWEWGPIYPIAEAMRKAGRELRVPLTWGGAWDLDFIHDNLPPEGMVNGYVQRRRKQGRKAFIDGPHFELR